MCVFLDAWLAVFFLCLCIPESSNIADKTCTILLPFLLPFLFLTFFSWSPRHVEQRPNSKVPYVHSLFPCRIIQWVTQEVHALVFSALTHDLLGTLTSFKPRDNPCRHLGCREKHKPGLAERLSLSQWLLCKFALSRFEFLGYFYQLPTSYSYCVILQKIRWKRVPLWIKTKWAKEQTHRDRSYSRTKAWLEFEMILNQDEKSCIIRLLFFLCVINWNTHFSIHVFCCSLCLYKIQLLIYY